jgi:hypothetical protein
MRASAQPVPEAPQDLTHTTRDESLRILASYGNLDDGSFYKHNNTLIEYCHDTIIMFKYIGVKINDL